MPETAEQNGVIAKMTGCTQYTLAYGFIGACHMHGVYV